MLNSQDGTSKGSVLGRANKTEAVQIRVDPKRRFTLEMVARRTGGPLSTLLEAVISEWLTNTQPDTCKRVEKGWSPFVADRFIMQSQDFTDTLTDMERLLWARIAMDNDLWRGDTKRPRPKATEANFDFDLLRDKWESLCAQSIESSERQELLESIKQNMNRKGANR
jgi:hypothetical protein